MAMAIPQVNTPKALEFGHKTPEGISVWRNLLRWRRHNTELEKLKSSHIPKGAARLKAYQQDLIKARSKLKFDHGQAKEALKKAYNTPDIRTEYEKEIFDIALELGMWRTEFVKYATPDREQDSQKSLPLVPSYA